MAIVRRATETTQTEWRPVPEGLWRWRLDAPEVRYSEKYSNYRVRFPLTLTDSERERLQRDHGPAPEGAQQSWRTSYTVGLSLGYVQRSGEYKSTKLVDFLAAAFGTGSQKKFRQWIAAGGGPALDEDADTTAQVDAVTEWLRWWEGLEVYGSIRHEADQEQPGVVWSRFGGPLPVGSLPGERDDEYQALARGKLRALVAESGGQSAPATGETAEPAPAEPPASTSTKPAAASTPRRYEEIFDDDEPVIPSPPAAARPPATAARPATRAAAPAVDPDGLDDLAF